MYFAPNLTQQKGVKIMYTNVVGTILKLHLLDFCHCHQLKYILRWDNTKVLLLDIYGVKQTMRQYIERTVERNWNWRASCNSLSDCMSPAETRETVQIKNQRKSFFFASQSFMLVMATKTKSILQRRRKSIEINQKIILLST